MRTDLVTTGADLLVFRTLAQLPRDLRVRCLYLSPPLPLTVDC
jgi:hypothetical protein